MAYGKYGKTSPPWRQADFPVGNAFNRQLGAGLASLGQQISASYSDVGDPQKNI